MFILHKNIPSGRLHISSNLWGQWSGWGGGGKEGKVVCMDPLSQIVQAGQRCISELWNFTYTSCVQADAD